MKKYFVALFAILALVTAGFAGASSSDQGRRLTGPFCVGQAWLKPVHVGGFKISRAGNVRSVAVTEECQTTELRKVGLAVPDPDVATPGVPGPKGDTGAQGAKGDTGPQGPAGELKANVYYFCLSSDGTLKQAVANHPCDHQVALYGP